MKCTILCAAAIVAAGGSITARAAIENTAVVFVDTVKPMELFETLTYPARIVPKINTVILAEMDGIVHRIHTPLGQRVSRNQSVMTITHTDPVYQYAPVSVKAPVTGVVSQVDVTEGSQVLKGQRLATVTDPSQVRITVEVPAQDMSLLSQGMKGEFKFSGRDDKIAIRVRGMSPFVDPATGTAGCELELDGKTPIVLSPGLLGQVSFKAGSHQGISIPDYAVIYHGSDTLIRLVSGGKSKQVPIKLGRKQRGNVEVLNGLQADAKYVLRSSRYVADGESVTVQEQGKVPVAK